MATASDDGDGDNGDDNDGFSDDGDDTFIISGLQATSPSFQVFSYLSMGVPTSTWIVPRRTVDRQKGQKVSQPC